MKTKYIDLDALLKNNLKAWRYFSGLPSSIKERIRMAPINTFSDLEAHANQLMRRDT